MRGGNVTKVITYKQAKYKHVTTIKCNVTRSASYVVVILIGICVEPIHIGNLDNIVTS